MPDVVWQAFRQGRGHIYYALLAIIGFAVFNAIYHIGWFDVIIAALAGGVLADCWAHEYTH
jgi:hypothetical protein